MMGSAKSQWAFWCLLPKLSRYSLTLLLSAVLLSIEDLRTKISGGRVGRFD